MKKTLLALTGLIILAATGYGQANCDCDLKPWTPKACYDKCWKALVGNGKVGISSLTGGELLMVLKLPAEVATKVADVNRELKGVSLEMYKKELGPVMFQSFMIAVEGLSEEQTKYIATPLKDREKILFNIKIQDFDKSVLKQDRIKPQ